MLTISNLPLCLLVIISELSVALSLNIPIPLGIRSDVNQWPSTMCTSNITIPTPTDNCIKLCSPVETTQKMCRDNTFCMCRTTTPTELKSCLECIVDGAGSFIKSFPGYLETIGHQISSYGALCNLETTTTTIDPATADPRGLDAVKKIRSLCYVDPSPLTSVPRITGLSLGPLRSSRFHTFFPMFSFCFAIVLLALLLPNRRREFSFIFSRRQGLNRQ